MQTLCKPCLTCTHPMSPLCCAQLRSVMSKRQAACWVRCMRTASSARSAAASPSPAPPSPAPPRPGAPPRQAMGDASADDASEDAPRELMDMAHGPGGRLAAAVRAASSSCCSAALSSCEARSSWGQARAAGLQPALVAAGRHARLRLDAGRVTALALTGGAGVPSEQAGPVR